MLDHIRSYAELIDWAKQQLLQSDTPALDARVLLCHCLNVSPTYLMTWPERHASTEQINQFKALVTARKLGQPIAYLTGYREFWSLPLAVSPDTLIPRPDTEILVEHALQLVLPENARVLDLGTGTGAIALALASEKPDWQITAVDVKPQAVELAKKNAQRLGFHNVTIAQSDWFAALHGEFFDLIISNPPYVESTSPLLLQGDVRFEPLSALISGEHGLDDIKQICCQCVEYLLPGGWLLVEHGYQQGPQVADLFSQSGLLDVITLQDLGGLDRATCGHLK